MSDLDSARQKINQAKTSISESEANIQTQRGKALEQEIKLKAQRSKLPTTTQKRLRGDGLFSGLQGRNRRRQVGLQRKEFDSGIKSIEEYKNDLLNYESGTLDPYKQQVASAEDELKAIENYNNMVVLAQNLANSSVKIASINDPALREMVDKIRYGEDVSIDTSALQHELTALENAGQLTEKFQLFGKIGGVPVSNIMSLRNLPQQTITRDIAPVYSIPGINEKVLTNKNFSISQERAQQYANMTNTQPQNFSLLGGASTFIKNLNLTKIKEDLNTPKNKNNNTQSINTTFTPIPSSITPFRPLDTRVVKNLFALNTYNQTSGKVINTTPYRDVFGLTVRGVISGVNWLTSGASEKLAQKVAKTEFKGGGMEIPQKRTIITGDSPAIFKTPKFNEQPLNQNVSVELARWVFFQPTLNTGVVKKEIVKATDASLEFAEARASGKAFDEATKTVKEVLKSDVIKSSTRRDLIKNTLKEAENLARNGETEKAKELLRFLKTNARQEDLKEVFIQEGIVPADTNQGSIVSQGNKRITEFLENIPKTNVFFPNIQGSQDQNIIFATQKDLPSQKIISKPASLSLFSQKNIPKTKQVSGLDQSLGLRNETETIPKSKQQFRQSSDINSLLKTRTVQQQALKQESQTQQKTKSGEINKPFIIDLFLGLNNKRKEKKNKTSEEELFEIFAKSKGQTVKIGRAGTEFEAFGKLKKGLKSTLSASGWVEKAGRKVSATPFISKEFRTSKRSRDILVQRRGFRLGTPSEVFQIGRAKKSKKKRGWL